MLRLLVGLLFVGMTGAVHASEEKSGKVPTPKPFPEPTMLASNDTGFLFSNKPGESSVVPARAATFASAGESLGDTGTGNTSVSHSLPHPETETAPATYARWRNNNGDSRRFLTLVHHKHVEFNTERYKVTLHRHTALIETGNLKVGIGSGLTSMVWSKAL